MAPHAENDIMLSCDINQECKSPSMKTCRENHQHGTSRFHSIPLNILIVSPVFPPFLAVGGGVAITYKALADKLKRRGHKVTVLSSRLDNIDHGRSILYKGFPVIMPTLDNLRLFEKKIKKADVVVAPETCVLPFLTFLCQRFNTPLIMNVHTNVRTLLEERGVLGKYLLAPIMDSTMRIASKFASLTFTTSPSYKSVLLRRGYKVDGVFSPRIKTAIFEAKNDSIEDIEDARDWLSNHHADRPLMIYVGRWSHEKRIDNLVKCKPDNFTLAIVGDGPIAEKILSWHDPDKGIVCHQGMLQQDRIRVLYKASDLVVSASAFETLGMTVAEAHLCGTAAAVQAAPGFVTQIVHGENGYLIDYSNTIEAKENLKFAIEHLPSQQQVLATTGKLKRWDANLPNLEEEVERVAEMDRSSWTGVNIPMPLFWPIIFLYYIIQSCVTYPFNSVTFSVKKHSPGSGNKSDAMVLK